MVVTCRDEKEKDIPNSGTQEESPVKDQLENFIARKKTLLHIHSNVLSTAVQWMALHC